MRDDEDRVEEELPQASGTYAFFIAVPLIDTWAGSSSSVTAAPLIDLVIPPSV
jgi:hypothetical protein